MILGETLFENWIRITYIKWIYVEQQSHVSDNFIADTMYFVPSNYTNYILFLCSNTLNDNESRNPCKSLLVKESNLLRILKHSEPKCTITYSYSHTHKDATGDNISAEFKR